MRRDDDVAGFDVAMNDGWLEIVQVRDGIERFQKPLMHLRGRERALAFDASREIFAAHKFHHEILRPIRLDEKIKHLHEIWMPQLREQLRLMLKLLLRVLLRVHIFFDRADAIQTGIERGVHGTKSARCKRFADMVAAAKDGVGGEGHFGIRCTDPGALWYRDSTDTRNRQWRPTAKVRR